MTYTEPLYAPHPSEPAPAAIELRGVTKEFDTPGGGRYQAEGGDGDDETVHGVPLVKVGSTVTM